MKPLTGLCHKQCSAGARQLPRRKSLARVQMRLSGCCGARLESTYGMLLVLLVRSSWLVSRYPIFFSLLLLLTIQEFELDSQDVDKDAGKGKSSMAHMAMAQGLSQTAELKENHSDSLLGFCQETITRGSCEHDSVPCSIWQAYSS